MIAFTDSLFGAGIASQPMRLIKAKIVAPDSSHWAKWIDAALSSDREERGTARRFHGELLEAGRIPLLSWHHLEELLAIQDDVRARERVAFIQSLPLVAFMRLSFEEVGLGAITDILAAEVLAAARCDGDAISIRDRAKELLLRTGSGRDAIGEEGWVWDAIRPAFKARSANSKMVMAVKGFRAFDDRRTIGEISKGAIRSSSEQSARAEAMRLEFAEEVRARGDRKIEDKDAVADDFMSEVMALPVPAGISVRDLLTTALTAQGVDEDEIRDDILLSDLNDLAKFRTRLRIVCSGIGLSFEALKRVDRDSLPSWLVERALGRHGQDRLERKGSDLNDGNLATLAPYVDELYVDKRTAEDFRRVMSKAPAISNLIGKISTAPNYVDMLQ